MTLFVWKPSYEIGIAEIDQQHRKLVGMINELFDAMKEGHGQLAMYHILDSLMDYVQLHFTTEEYAMREHHYPDLDAHMKEHLELTTQVLGLQKRRRSGAKIATPELFHFLKDWLQSHITKEDRKFGDFLKKSKHPEPQDWHQ